MSIYIYYNLIPKSNGLVGCNSTWLDCSPKFNLLLMEKDLSPFKIVRVIHFIFSRCLPLNPVHITNIIIYNCNYSVVYCIYNVPLTLFGTFFIEEFSKGFGQWQQWWTMWNDSWDGYALKIEHEFGCIQVGGHVTIKHIT